MEKKYLFSVIFQGSTFYVVKMYNKTKKEIFSKNGQNQVFAPVLFLPRTYHIYEPITNLTLIYNQSRNMPTKSSV